MRIVSGYFDTYAAAADAVALLTGAGVARSDISILARDPDGKIAERERFEETAAEAGEGFEQGAGVGALLGGTGGLIAGVSGLAVPGLGPIFLGGWIAVAALGAAAGALVGGAAGGLIGALVHAGIPEDEAHAYADRLADGGAVVTARVSDEFHPSARAILEKAGQVDHAPVVAGPIDENWLDFEGEHAKIV